MTLIELLTPTPSTTLRFFRPDDVGGRTPWLILIRDGRLQRLHGDVAMAAGDTLDPELRAASLGLAYPSLVATDSNATVAVSGLAAAWVYCGGEPPPFEAVYAEGRKKPRLGEEGAIRSMRNLGSETRPISNIFITTLERTAIEVARFHPRPLALPVISSLVAAGADLAAARALLNRSLRVPGRSMASNTLAIAAQTAL